jgi:hypothetical protein
MEFHIKIQFEGGGVVGGEKEKAYTMAAASLKSIQNSIHQTEELKK